MAEVRVYLQVTFASLSPNPFAQTRPVTPAIFTCSMPAYVATSVLVLNSLSSGAGNQIVHCQNEMQ